MSAYLDTNVFFFAGFGEETDPRTQKAREILLKMTEGKETYYTSLITVDELIWAVIKQKKDRKTAIQQGFRLHQLSIKFVPLVTSISIKALHLMQRYQISPRDALHAASCLEVNADKIITDDSDFNVIKEVKRIGLE